MRKLLIFGAFASVAAANAQQAPTIVVTPTIAPNAFGSPNWDPWIGNSYQAQYNGSSSFGTVGTPAYYLANNLVTDRAQVIVTGYNSWMGDANPTGAFSAELGNRMHFGLHIFGNGNKFAINDVKFDSSSTGDGDGLGFGFGFGSYNYSNAYVGIDYVDGVRGNGDDILITGGANTQLVDELIGRGSGNSYDSYVTDPGATNQDKLWGVAYDPAKQWDTYTGVYTLRGFGDDITGSGSFQAVPEPTTMAALGFGALAMLRKRRKKA
jgi:hypothetical protein